MNALQNKFKTGELKFKRQFSKIENDSLQGEKLEERKSDSISDQEIPKVLIVDFDVHHGNGQFNHSSFQINLYGNHIFSKL